jgi:hypothetical protein
MRSLILIAALLSAGCSMTPAQKRWTAIGVGVVATGLVLAHETDNGRGPMGRTAASGGKSGPFNPCPSGNSRSCK